MNPKKRPLHFADHLFFYLDKKSQPMHIMGIFVFELPEKVSEQAFFAPLIDEIQTGKALPIFPLNQKLKNRLFWEIQDNFDYQQHFFVNRLTDKQNQLDDLFALVGCLHEVALSRAKPLWEFHLVQNLAPESLGKPHRFAVVLKIHHTMTDGIALMRLLKSSLADNPAEQCGFPFWQTAQTATKAPQKTQKQNTAKPSKPLLTSGFANVKNTATALFDRLGDQPDGFTSPYQTPKSLLNQPIDHTRQVVVKAFAKSRFSTLARHFKTTTNDIALAVCSGALRQYLLGENALPNKSLTTFVPVSLRRDDTQAGNQLSFLPATLGTDKNNPLDRLADIEKSMADGKNRFQNLSPSQVVAYSAVVYGAVMANLITGVAPYRQGFNVLISNVPASRTPLYLNGAKLTNIYPASVLFQGQAMNITFANFLDTIDFGITVCPSVLPNADKLPVLLENALGELETIMATGTNT